MKKWIVTLTVAVIALPLFAAGSQNVCALDQSVLAPYAKGAQATEQEWAASRLAVSEFMSCDPASADHTSRRIFFELVEREFTTDHKPALDKWREKRPGSEALFEGLTVFQHELRSYMERLVNVHRDAESKGTVVRFGTPKTIAAFGPASRQDVLAMLSVPHLPYGVSNQYNAQVDAIGTLGEWIDPSSASFNASDKAKFVAILTGLLPVSDSVRPGHHARLVETALKALARSDDARAEQAIRRWMEKQTNKKGWLYQLASKSAEKIQKNAQKKNG